MRFKQIYLAPFLVGILLGCSGGNPQQTEADKYPRVNLSARDQEMVRRLKLASKGRPEEAAKVLTEAKDSLGAAPPTAVSKP